MLGSRVVASTIDHGGQKGRRQLPGPSSARGGTRRTDPAARVKIEKALFLMGCFVGVDDLPHQRVSHHVPLLEESESDFPDRREDRDHGEEA